MNEAREMNAARRQELVARSLVLDSGVDLSDDPRSYTEIAIESVKRGDIDPALAASEGLEIPPEPGELDLDAVGALRVGLVQRRNTVQ